MAAMTDDRDDHDHLDQSESGLPVYCPARHF